MLDDWDFSASPQTLVDQIDEAGEEWGLCAFVDEEQGRVFVCEKTYAAEAYGGLGDVSREGVGRRLMSVDDECPFDAVFEMRVPLTDDPGAVFRRHDDLVAAEKKRQSDDMLADFKATMARKLRGGAIFYPGMNDILHLNRQQRRAAEAARRRGR